MANVNEVCDKFLLKISTFLSENQNDKHYRILFNLKVAITGFQYQNKDFTVRQGRFSELQKILHRKLQQIKGNTSMYEKVGHFLSFVPTQASPAEELLFDLILTTGNIARENNLEVLSSIALLATPAGIPSEACPVPDDLEKAQAYFPFAN